MENPRKLWQKQEVETMRFSVEELRAKAGKLQRRIGRRNLREYLAALVVMAFCGVASWNTPQLIPRIAYALLIVAATFYVWYLHRWGSARPAPAEMGSADCARFYRDELMRQRDLLRSVWKWAIGPVLPGILLLAVYNISSAQSSELWRQLLYVVLEGAIFLAVAWGNLLAARRLDGRIAELNRDLGAI